MSLNFAEQKRIFVFFNDYTILKISKEMELA